MNQTVAAASGTESVEFAFVAMLARAMSVGKVDLPSFPDIAMRVRRALEDERVAIDTIVRVIGAEPALAARLLRMANSAGLNGSGPRITELRLAIARLGFDLLRSTAISFAMLQLSQAEAFKHIRDPLRSLWQRSALVAAMAHVVAKRLTRVNPDAAALAGILHGIGKLFIRVRAIEYPALFSSPEVYGRIEQSWHANIAKALLENWEMADEVVAAVHLHEDLDYTQDGEADLTDVLIISNRLVNLRLQPNDIELSLQGVSAARRIGLEVTAYPQLLTESATEIEALRSALGS
jgi:HD-like signal output (HDOD) protein